MEYPSWAPADLVAWHRELVRKDADEDYQGQLSRLLRPLAIVAEGIEKLDAGTKPQATSLASAGNNTRDNFRLLLDRFIFCPDAEAMWAAFNRTPRFKSEQDVDYSCVEHRYFGPASRYLTVCMNVLCDFEDHPLQTRREKKSDLAQIAAKAAELAVMLAQSCYFHDLRLCDIRWFADSSIQELSQEEIAEGLIQDRPPTENEEKAAVYAALICLRGASEGTAQGSGRKNDARLLARYSQMPVIEIVNNIVAIAEKESLSPPPLLRPRSMHAKRQFVARNLKDVHMEIFGSPMWDALAIACTLIVDPSNQLAADDIRPYCR